MRYLTVILLVVLSVVFTNFSEAQVVCDKFKLSAENKGEVLGISVDTDLPDDTVVFVNVNRVYLQKNNPTEFSVTCFKGDGTVKDWKVKTEVPISNKVCAKALRALQDKMASFDAPFKVASVDDEIEVIMIVANYRLQTNPLLKIENPISGKALKSEEFRGMTVNDSIIINQPMKY